MRDHLSDQDMFETWLIHMDDALEAFRAHFSAEVAEHLTFTPDSLDVVEAWLLSRYPDVVATRPRDEAPVIDGAARYIGETYRKHLGGKWMIDYTDPKNAFYGMPQMTGMRGQSAQICPLTLTTATTDRRTGTFLRGILERQLSSN